MRLLLLFAFLLVSPSLAAEDCAPHREGQPFILILDDLDPDTSWVNLWIDGIQQPMRNAGQWVNGEARWEFKQGLPRGVHRIEWAAYTGDGLSSGKQVQDVTVLPPLFETP